MNNRGQIIPIFLPMYNLGDGGEIPESSLWVLGAILSGVVFIFFLLIESMFHSYSSETLMERVMELWIPFNSPDFSLPIYDFLWFGFRLILPIVILGIFGYLIYRIKAFFVNTQSMRNK